MNIKDAWKEAAHTERYSSFNYAAHHYLGSEVELEKLSKEVKTGDKIAQLIMAKFIELRLKD